MYLVTADASGTPNKVAPAPTPLFTQLRSTCFHSLISQMFYNDFLKVFSSELSMQLQVENKWGIWLFGKLPETCCLPQPLLLTLLVLYVWFVAQQIVLIPHREKNVFRNKINVSYIFFNVRKTNVSIATETRCFPIQLPRFTYKWLSIKHLCCRFVP